MPIPTALYLFRSSDAAVELIVVDIFGSSDNLDMENRDVYLLL